MEHEHMMTSVELIMCSFSIHSRTCLPKVRGCITLMRVVGGSKAVLAWKEVVPEGGSTQRFRCLFRCFFFCGRFFRRMLSQSETRITTEMSIYSINPVDHKGMHAPSGYTCSKLRETVDSKVYAFASETVNFDLTGSGQESISCW